MHGRVVVHNISLHNAPQHTPNLNTHRTHLSAGDGGVKIRPQACVCTTEEESGLRCAAVISMNITLIPTYMLRQMKRKRGRVDADPGGEAGWNHHFTKHTKQFVSFARSRLKNTSALGPAVHDSEGMCQSKAGHGIFSTTRADGD